MADADLAMLQLPDADIGDSGAHAASCYSCIEATCGTELAACSADCECDRSVLTFVTCITSGQGNAIGCGSPLLTSRDPSELALIACVGGMQLGGIGPGCPSECGVAGFGSAEGGMMTEGGTTEAGPSEGGTAEGGSTEAGATEAGTSDAGLSDTGAAEAGTEAGAD
jgi:hypothetical protein